MYRTLDKSKKIETIIYIGIFAILLVCNLLTRYLSDDYSYYFSCATGEPLENVWQIFPSMAVHALKYNGRLSVHFLVQLFVLLPLWVFDLLNSAMFCLQIVLINRFCFEEKRSNFRTIAIFCGIWLWELAFGQVNLWQDGAMNYLWSCVFMLLFLYPFAARFMKGTDFSAPIPGKVGFVLFSLLVGSYSETVSAASIFVAFLLLIMDIFCNHRKISRYGLVCVAASVVGYITIYLAPSQWVNKSAGTSMYVLANNFGQATKIYSQFGVLIAAFVVLLVICLQEKVSPKRILLALALAAGSLAANYIMIFAKYYIERSSVGAFLLLITAVAVLVPPVLKLKPWKTVLASAMIMMALSTVHPLCTGIMDIYNMYVRGGGTELYIQECIANGDLDIELPIEGFDTKYTAYYYNTRISEFSDFWLNECMAKYYGLNSITGYLVDSE